MAANEYSMDDLKAWAGVKGGGAAAGEDKAPEKVVAGVPQEGDEPLPGEEDVAAGAPHDYMNQAVAEIEACLGDLKEVGVMKASKGFRARYESTIQDLEDAAKELKNLAAKYEMEQAGNDPNMDGDEDFGDEDDEDVDPDAEEGDEDFGAEEGDEEEGGGEEDDSDDEEEDDDEEKDEKGPPKKKAKPAFGKK